VSPAIISICSSCWSKSSSKARVIAKIENQQALDNIDALVEASGGIMIARGDLGSECPIEDLPLIQRQIVERCSYHGRKVIVATQMLESMIENPVPTRAEVTDIFNAVIEQVDCVMLSGETSVGRYPEKCVEVLDTVIRRIEQKYPSGRFASDAPLKTNKHKTVKAAILLANSIPGSKLLVFTLRGVMAHLLAHQRPEFAPIFAFTPNLHVSRTLVTARGVHPFVLEFTEGQPESSIREALDLLRRENLIKPGDPLVILSDALYDGVNVDAILLRRGLRRPPLPRPAPLRTRKNTTCSARCSPPKAIAVQRTAARAPSKSPTPSICTTARCSAISKTPAG
jgi:pyruvate kinase